MGTTVQAELTNDEYERLDKLKDEHGLTWRGMLIKAGDVLEST